MKAMHEQSDSLLAFEKWRRCAGISRTTGWRWRRDGWLTTLNINGRVYVEVAEVARFISAARSGKFAKTARPAQRELQPREPNDCP